MSISLIVNSGIQFHKFDIVISPNADLIRPIGFYEFLDEEMERISVEYAYFLPDFDFWTRKWVLKEENYLNDDNSLKGNININILKPWALKQEVDYYTISDITDCLDYFASSDEKKIWIPIPYFKRNANGQSIFGPIGWCRMMIIRKPTIEKKAKPFSIVLIFDTTTGTDDYYFAPKPNDTTEEENRYGLTNNEDHLLKFCDSAYGCDWVERCVRKIVQKDSEPKEFPWLKHIAYFIYLVKYLEASGTFPEIELLSDVQKPIDVDLVLDIGNANTCGLLFENSFNNSSFDFNSVKKLRLYDLSDPQKEYNEPFSMRLAFVEPRFGDIYIPQHKNFKWPSILRLGKEASRLINHYNVDVYRGREAASHHSSPKRYLWDDTKSNVPWEYINFTGTNILQSIYYEGVSEQFKENGEYAYDGNFACLPLYSRKSLMTFVYIEIFLHSISQINSHEFRMSHGNAEKPRRLRRITITCPTSIIQKEQVVLREGAVEAVRVLGRFFKGNFIGKYDPADQVSEIEVIPKPKDLAKKISELSFKKDWIYDEATCCQLVFLYAEISKRYLNNADVFFKLYGKIRKGVTYEDQTSLTIASIDVGGGTTDLMISSYQHEIGQSAAVIRPHPLYWESFTLAGDDLLKEIVQQIIIEGSTKEQDENGTIGIIESACRVAGVTDISIKLNSFFGTDNSSQPFIHRIFRKNFIVQCAIPIAQRYLNHAAKELPDEYLTFDQMFEEAKPNPQLIGYFNKHFHPLKFEDIRWKLSVKKVNAIVENTFDPLFRQLSAIISSYGCDFLLLAGTPTTLPKIRELFIKYYPVSPERLITLNSYRVGRWYPFANELGYFTDPKTLVAVGAIIALMGGSLDKLDGFRLNTQLLRRNLISTSDYIGLMNPYTFSLDEIFVTPDSNSFEIEIHTLPMKLGYKQLPSKNYRARPIYKLSFNEEYINEKVLEQNPSLSNSSEISRAQEEYKNNLKIRMPFRVKLKRDWSSSRELLNIDSVKDTNKNESSRQLLDLSFITLIQEKGYWLDTGEFVLNI